MQTFRSLGIIAGIAGLSACELGTGPSVSSPAVETDSASYAVRTTSYHWEVSIAYAFTNETDRAVSFLNCGGHPLGVVEKRVANAWVLFWGPVTRACIGPPVEVEAGAVYRDTYTLAVPHSPPYFVDDTDASDLTGTFRLVLRDAVYEYNPVTFERGPDVPLAYRVSNRFTLRAIAP